MSETSPTDRAHRVIAWGFVAIQAVLIAAVVLVPRDSQWPVTRVLEAIGWAAMVGGIALGLWAARYLGRGLTPSPLPNGATGLVTLGPYRYVRHPMYTAVMLLVCGVAVRSGSWLVIGLTASLAALFWVKSSWEEQRLTETFPGYAAYRQAVPRFVPVPGRAAGYAG